MTRHGRLPWLAPEELTAEQRALYDTIVGGARATGPQAFQRTDDAGRLEGPFNAMLTSPGLGTALQELGSTIRFRTGIPNRAREIAILEVARLRRCDFEWFAHERVGRAAGLTGDEIAAIRSGSAAPTFDATERSAYEVTGTLVRERDLDDAAFATARAVLGEPMLMELIALVGYYELLGLSMRVWRTPLPAGTEVTY